MAFNLRSFTPARVALGASMPTSEVLRFALDHALARDAVQVDLGRRLKTPRSSSPTASPRSPSTATPKPFSTISSPKSTAGGLPRSW